MKVQQGNEMHTFRWSIGVILTGVAVGSAALTVGTVRNPVWLEQTLDIAVPVQLDAGTQSGNLCAKADVFYADSMLGASQVQITQESTETPESVKLRITTSTPVNEPVVTVVLQVGCDQKVTRRLVLLPDVPVLNDAPRRTPGEAADAGTVPLAPTAIVGGEAAPAPGSATSAVPTAAPAAVVVPSAPVVARPKRKARLQLELRAPAPRAPVVVAPAPQPAAGPEGSRLALEPLAALGERVRKLDETPGAAPPESAASEPEAPPVDRLQQLQSDIQLLVKQAAENDAKLTALRVRMEQAEAERSTLATALGVGVVVLLLVGALAFWLYRRQQLTERDEDSDLDTEELMVDFNPVDADHWMPPPPKAAPVPPVGTAPPAP